ncbi:MAG: hypothetical protein JWQ72_2743 [Polaromonas sp.]|nr:hypothetical protein [Polaromonas sp.]
MATHCYRGVMPDSKYRETLAIALQIEMEQISDMELEYNALVLQMAAYKAGKGELPTVAQFEAWRESMRTRLKMAEMIYRDSRPGASLSIGTVPPAQSPPDP